MKKFEWVRKIAALPDNLTPAQAAVDLGQPETTVRAWMKKLGYPFIDGRSIRWTDDRKKEARKIDVSKIDWTKSFAENARILNCSREAIRQIKDKLDNKKDSS